MRNKRRNDLAASAADAQYCALCETVMLFERVETGDQPADDQTSEWICITCGSALLIGPPPASLDQTA